MTVGMCVSLSLLPRYEELVEVITRAMAKLSLDWPAECHVEPQRGSVSTGRIRPQNCPVEKGGPTADLLWSP